MAPSWSPSWSSRTVAALTWSWAASIVDLLDALLVDLRQRLVVGADRREAREVVLGGLARRVLGQGAGEAPEGAVEVVEGDLVELGDAVQQLHPPVGRARVPRLDLVNRDELLELALVAVDGLEDLGDQQLVLLVVDEPLEGLQSRLVGGLALEHLAVALDGRVGVAHALFAQLRQAQHQGLLLLRIGGHRQLALDVVGQVGPHLLPGVQVVEGAQRALTGGLEIEDLLVDGDGLARLLEHLVVDERHLGEELLLLVRIGGDLGAPPQHADQITPALGASVQVLEGSQHLEVGRVLIENPRVGLYRSVHVLELQLADLRRLHPQGARQHRVGGAGAELADQGHQILEALLLDGQHLEATQGLLALGHLAQRVGEGLEALLLVADTLAVDLAHLGEEIEAPLPIGALRVQHLEGADELLPLAAHLVDGLQDLRGQRSHLGVGQQALQRLAATVVLREDGEDLAVQIDGARLVVEVLLERASHAELERRELLVRLGAEVDATLERLHEIVPPALRFVEGVEGTEGLGLVLTELAQDALVGLDGLVRVGELVLP